MTDLATKVLFPKAVELEVLAGPTNDSARKLFESQWATTIDAGDIPASVIEWGLGSGESSVLALAMTTPSATVVLDDASARMAARSLNIPLIGTLGVIVRAKQRNLIPSASMVLQQLISTGLYLDANLVRTIVKQLGETWPE